MQLEFGGKSVTPDVRRLFDMREVIYDKKWLAAAEYAERNGAKFRVITERSIYPKKGKK